MNAGITSGFFKGTPSSDIVECLRHLKACVSEISHPMLLPIIMYSHHISEKTEIQQREARDWLKRLEYAVSLRPEIQESGLYFYGRVIDLDAVNRDLVECHSQVLWKRPVAYIEILDSIKEVTTAFYERLPKDKKLAVRRLQASLQSRLEFSRKRWQGLENYANTTLRRLEIQTEAVS